MGARLGGARRYGPRLPPSSGLDGRLGMGQPYAFGSLTAGPASSSRFLGVMLAAICCVYTT